MQTGNPPNCLGSGVPARPDGLCRSHGPTFPRNVGCVGWCGREDSNFHGLSATATSTLRVYQFRHDRTREMRRTDARRPGKARPLAKAPQARNGTGRSHAGTVVNAPFTKPPARSYGHEDGRTSRLGLAGRRQSAVAAAADARQRPGSRLGAYRRRRPRPSRRRAAARWPCGQARQDHRRRWHSPRRQTRGISVSYLPLQAGEPSNRTRKCEPPAGTSTSALLKLALAPGPSVGAGGAIVQL